MNTVKGWERSTMIGLFAKEATFNAGVTMANDSCSMKSYDLAVNWNDTITTDKDEFTGTEHGTDQEILAQGCKFTYKESHAKPNSLIGLASLVFGSSTPTQDGNDTAYSHLIVPVAHGTALPSTEIEDLQGGIQYAYTGVKGDTLKLSGKAGGYLELEAGLIGSGSREEDTAEFTSAITESWMKIGDAKVFFETSGDITIAASPAQGVENISSSTPDDFGPRMQDFEFVWNNKLKGQPGFGGGLVLQDLDYTRRTASLKFTLLFNDAAELAYYTAQAPCAFEINFKGALIAEGGTMYYGGILIIPRMKLKNAPLPKGGPNDTLTADFECEIYDDGTNSAVIFKGFNAQAAYLA